MKTLPDCGLFVSGVSLAGHEEQVPANRLIYFHNHSEKGPPLIQMPTENTHNRWAFSERGWLVEDEGFIRAMKELKPEGYYLIAGGNLQLGGSEVLRERTLIQLGYNRLGESLLFVGRFEGNSIVFPSKGYRFIERKVQERLEPSGFHTPYTYTGRTLH